MSKKAKAALAAEDYLQTKEATNGYALQALGDSLARGVGYAMHHRPNPPSAEMVKGLRVNANAVHLRLADIARLLRACFRLSLGLRMKGTRN